MKKQSTALRLFRQLHGQRVRLTVICISIIIYVGLEVWTPMYSALVIDQLWQSIKTGWENEITFRITWDNMGRELLQLAIQYFCMWLFYFLQSFLMANVADTLVMNLRKQVAAKLNRLPLRFFDQNKAGGILSRVTSDLEKMSDVMQTGLLKLIVSIGTIIGSICMMFYYSISLTLLFLAFMLFSAVITWVVSKKSLRFAGERMESIGNLTGLAEEYYNGRNVIKAYNHETDSLKKIVQAAEKARIANQRVEFLSNCVNPLIRLLTRISHAVIALLAGRALLGGRMTIGVMQALFQHLNLASEPLTEASYMLNSMQTAIAAAKRTFALLDEAAGYGFVKG